MKTNTPKFEENHHFNSKYKTIEDLFDAIKKTQDCWVWLNTKDKLGYGIAGRRGLAHILVYQTLVGEVPEGLELDHTCRNTSCVNPEHLEPVPHKVNVLRGVGPTAENAKKTHCKRGHEFTPANTRWGNFNKASRFCRTCDKAYKQKWNREKTAENHAKGLNSKGYPFTDENKKRRILCPQV